MTRECLSIGELAKRTGVPISTIRFYERQGLVSSDGRTGGNYRYFGPRARTRLLFIRAAQASGLSLDDIKLLCRLDDGVTRPCKDVQEVIESRLASVTGQMKQMRQIEKVLRSYREACLKNRKNQPCPVLETLGKPAK